MKYKNILQSIGNTPVVDISTMYGNTHQVWIKLERANPGGSIKDRIALSMIEDAEKKGLINKNSVIVEPTSGNTGIGLAMVAAVKGYRIVLVMPESMSVERRRQMKAFGAEIVLTPKTDGMKGSIAMANELLAEIPGAWMPFQFENQANPEIHRSTTAMEIISDFPEGLDFMITGVGTGGHITGVGEVLKQHFPNIKIIAVEPSASPVLSGGEPAPHMIQGIGAGFVPAVLNREVIDEVIVVENEEAFDYAQKIAKTQGIFTGISTGATLAAVGKKIAGREKSSSILAFNYDTGERYLSIPDLF
jgi:cysteine synthase A